MLHSWPGEAGWPSPAVAQTLVIELGRRPPASVSPLPAAPKPALLDSSGREETADAPPTMTSGVLDAFLSVMAAMASSSSLGRILRAAAIEHEQRDVSLPPPNRSSSSRARTAVAGP